ncbi:MAG: F0F1 ATP synthase subunit epsilon [Bacteroidales bacterium]|nr:F0F1 ATP synthase subunit epsilon [Bacteroidales bacterium]
MIILDIISPERSLVHESVGSVELPGSFGRFEVLKDHAPLISSLDKGDVVYRMEDDKEGRVSISSGFVEVCGNHVMVCVEL